jgi:hypothetical protein
MVRFPDSAEKTTLSAEGEGALQREGDFTCNAEFLGKYCSDGNNSTIHFSYLLILIWYFYPSLCLRCESATEQSNFVLDLDCSVADSLFGLAGPALQILRFLEAQPPTS